MPLVGARRQQPLSMTGQGGNFRGTYRAKQREEATRVSIHVLHILNRLNPSGAERMLHAAALCWRQAGITGEILSTGEDRGPFAEMLEAAGYPVHHIPFARSAQFLHRVYTLIRRGGYDVVHIHTERANFAYGVLARLAGVPRVVRTIHSVFPFQGLLRARRGVQRRFLRLIGVTMVGVSPSVQRVEQEHFGNPVILVPNWYDSKRIAPPTPTQREEARRRLGLRPDQVAILTIGNCSPQKNHTSLLKALQWIPESIPLVYLHVGLEAPGYPERRTAEELQQTGRVRFLGPMRDVVPALHAADVFVMPSVHEGFGVAALEAMGAGLPVLLADVPGLRDFRVMDVEEIVWVQPDPASIASGLRRLLELPQEERSAIGKRLHDAAQRSYGLHSGPAQYARLYKS